MNLRLLNRYEEITFDALKRSCESNGAHVYPKVRVADVFPLQNSGVSDAHFNYGLRSHFDFLVTDGDYQPLFSVEFDGPLHKTNEVQRQRDAMKNELCDHFGHSLLRINSKYLTPDYRGLDLLTYFVDAWFWNDAFCQAQQDGTIPYDEPFDMTFIYSSSQRNERKWPYWLSFDIESELEKLHEAGRIGQQAPSSYIGSDSEGNYRCLAWLVMDERSVLSTMTGMRAQRFPAISECDLVGMLATFDLYPKVKQAVAGQRVRLTDREQFFSGELPAFQKRFKMLGATSFGATV